MAEFLEEEIKLEKEGEKSPASFNGFDVSHNKAEITFTSKSNGET